MEIIFKQSLSETDKELLQQFSLCVNDISVYQKIDYPVTINNQNSFSTYCLMYDCDQIRAYAIIVESKLSKLPFIKIANIIQGPISNTIENEIYILTKIIDKYKKEKFAKIEVELRQFVSEKTEIIQYELFKKVNFKLDDFKNVKSTIILNLENEIEEIYKSFSTSLKTSIKKARNSNINISLIESEQDIRDFADVYVEMCKSRGIQLISHTEIIDQCLFAMQNNNGFLLKAMIDDKIIGGGVFVYNKEKTTYLFGASSPNHKKLPISHLVLFEAIKISQNLNIKVFDLGGYTFFANENDQAFGINKFKLNFSNRIVFYPRKLIIVNSKFKNAFFKLYMQLIKMIKS